MKGEPVEMAGGEVGASREGIRRRDQEKEEPEGREGGAVFSKTETVVVDGKTG